MTRLVGPLKLAKRRFFAWLAAQLRYAQEADRGSPSLEPGLVLGAGALLQPGFRVEVRLGPQENRVIVGTNAVLSCQITLERDGGVVRIGDNTFVGSSHIVCSQGVSIGSDVLIAWGCTIVDHDAHSPLWAERADDVARWREGLLQGGLAQASALKDWSVVSAAPICIKDKAWLGFGSIVLKGVTVGEGAVVAAGSVVTADVPDWTVAAGNPARVVKSLPRPSVTGHT